MSSRSGLVEIAKTLPFAQNKFGNTIDVVLPARGGPNTKTPCCAGANTSPSRL